MFKFTFNKKKLLHIFNHNHQIMKTLTYRLLLSLCLLFVFSCKIQKQNTSSEIISKDDGLIEFTFLQINDVYEIAALEGGKVGGMARVATLYNQLKKENPNTFFVLAGDFLNPSLIATMKHEGQRIKGRQMVEVMNVAGVDLVVFGNHEFDVKENELQARMNESTFDWLGTNVLQIKKDDSVVGGQYLIPFHKEQNGQKTVVEETYTWNIKDKDGTELSIGIIGATIDKNEKPYVAYEGFKEEAKKAYLELVCKTDLVIGLTHLEINQDLELAAELPNVPLLMGGHDHHHLEYQVGKVKVTKADANAKSAYVHRFNFNKKTGEYSFNSELVNIDESLTHDPKVKSVVDKWAKILDDNLTSIYPKPYEMIFDSPDELDGRESSVRTKQTKMGDIFAASIAAATEKTADLAIMNGGSIRLDDHLEGEIYAIDIFRAMPFGGQVWEMDLNGEVLSKVLEIGLIDQYGKGGFLQTHNVKFDVKTKTWLIGGEPLDSGKTYHVGLNNYLYSGSRSLREILQKFPVEKPKEGDANDARIDVRLAVIQYMKTL